MTFGYNSDVTINPICAACSNMISGGWCNCDSWMTGNVFGVYTNNDILSFMEVMAYTQKALQINPGVTVLIAGT